jgi:hypothetical protein
LVVGRWSLANALGLKPLADRNKLFSPAPWFAFGQRLTANGGLKPIS